MPSRPIRDPRRQAPILLLLLLLTSTLPLFAQTTPPDQPSPPTFTAVDIVAEVTYVDSVFWAGYNRCDIAAMAPLFSDDVEYYHDRDGLTGTRVDLVNDLRSGTCGAADRTVTRAPVAGTVGVYPLAGYGAVITGEHTFVTRDTAGTLLGEPEVSRFANVWNFSSGEWEMTRILSYDHRPLLLAGEGPYVDLSADALGRYAGTYSTGEMGPASVSVGGEGLRLVAGAIDAELRPRSEQVFSQPERALRVAFTFAADSTVTGFVVEEDGREVAVARRVVE